MFVAIFNNEEASYPVAVDPIKEHLDDKLSSIFKGEEGIFSQIEILEVKEGFESTVLCLKQASSFYNKQVGNHDDIGYYITNAIRKICF